MRPIHKTFTMAAASANAICLSQKPTAAGYLVINGALASPEMDTTQSPSRARTVATLDAYRRVSIASDADDSGLTVTITGTDPAGAVFTEALAGPNAGAVSSLNSFAKVLAVQVDGAAAGNLTVGTNDKADTPWIRTPQGLYGNAFELALQAQFSAGASLTWQWQCSISPAQDGSTAANKLATNLDTALTASGVKTLSEFPVSLVRATITNYVGGSVAYDILKSL